VRCSDIRKATCALVHHVLSFLSRRAYSTLSLCKSPVGLKKLLRSARLVRSLLYVHAYTRKVNDSVSCKLTTVLVWQLTTVLVWQLTTVLIGNSIDPHGEYLDKSP
jgi:hypothetical protein